jgi:Tc toxin complex TcA C-terminal TcB-binding domain/Neuraminidase-like domain
VLPYIDLVNEILERAVAPSAGFPQTTKPAEELRAQPEHRNDAAYAALAKATYPWSLPFAPPAEEARAYLNHLGTPRNEIMEAFRPEGSPEPSPQSIATDRLGLTPLERRIITGAPLNPPRTLQSFWGLSSLSLDQLRDRLVRPRAFLEQANLSYAEVVELFSTRFVASPARVIIDFEDGGCDLDRAVIEPQPSEPRLDRVHRFERLRRKLSWSIYDLDRAIAAFEPGQINENLLVALSGFTRLRVEFKVPFEEMLAWWSPLDTHVYRPQGRDDVPSLYQRVFQNPVVFDSETVGAFALDPTGTELERSGEELAAHLPSLAAALGASTEELRIAAGTDATLSLASLSELYRVVSFARTLGMPVHSLGALRRLSVHDPFASPASTIRFKDDLRTVTAAGFSLLQVEYFLAHTESPGMSVAPDDLAMAATLTQLRTALREIRAKYVVITDPEGTVTANALGILLDRPVLQSAVTLIRSGVLIPAGDPATFLQTHLPFLAVDAAMEALVGIGDSHPTLDPVSQTAERFGFVLAPLVSHLHQTLGRSIIVQTLAATFNLSARVLSALLGDTLAEFEDERLLAEDVEVSRSEFPEVFRTLYRLWKAGTIVSTLRLNDSEGEFLVTHAATLGVLDLRTLPGSEPPEGALADAFASFVRLIELVSLRESVGPSLVDLLRDAVVFRPEEDRDSATAAFLDRLHRLTGWEIDSLLFLASKGGLALEFPDQYRSGYALQRFRACFDVLKRLGLASAHVVPGWITDEVSPEASRAIRSAAKAKYDTAQWLEVARGINDNLRERLRDALVAHLLASRSDEFRDAADLHGHFLIDPEMSACQLTSRLRLAISSVQLFIQRALLNLETDVTISKEAAAEWQWMKLYRVWEANRKVFLYPENWIAPELREDKTPLFRDFEKALFQADISDQTLESALSAYVLGLAEIARPEISAVYRDPKTHTHHLFARTRELPHIYYHRRWDRARTWTPWERLPLDIEGEHLVPALIRERFYLFWPVFQEKSDPPKHGDDDTHTFHELRLAWSAWQEGEWSAKRLSEATLRLPGAPELNRYLFRALERSSEPIDQGGFQVSGSFGRKIVILLLPGPLASIELGRFQLMADGRVEVEALEGVLGKVEPGPDGGLLSGMAILDTGSERLVLPSAETDSFGNALISSLVHLVTLNRTPGEFRIVYPDQFQGYATQAAFTYEDGDATFLVQPIRRSQFGPSEGLSGSSTLSFGIRHTHGIDPNDVGGVFPLALERASLFANGLAENTGAGNLSETGDALTISPFVSASGSPDKKFRFYTHYHPQADDFVTALFNDGVDGILGRLEHQENGEPSFFEERYDPVSSQVTSPHPLDGVDFSYEGAYSVYNWELFFHIPLLVADRFQQEQRFADAQRWYHYVFDPTRCEDNNAPHCYWKVRPFFEYDLSDPESRPVQEMLITLSEGNMALSRQVEVWRENPFDPHSIALLRTIAYQKAVVMRYLDNLIAWADALFRQDTLETLNEATQLYVLATQILGERPERIDTGEHPPAKTFNDLEDSLDAFSNSLVEIENQLGPNGHINSATLTLGGGTSSSAPSPLGTTLFFCIPENEKLLGYWDTVEDRLFKIRHCMNIEGVVRTLPLFSPPIEPGLLVKAAAAGIDITSAVNDLQAPLGPYRFRFLLEKAFEVNNAVKALGSSLLDALSQRDGEALARIRAAHETELLKLVHDTKEKQLSEAGEQVVALRRSRNIADERKRHYEEIPNRIEEETEHLEELKSAGSAQERASSHDLTSADAARFIPDFSVGFSGVGPFATISLGRANVLAFYQFRSQEMSAEAGKSTHASNLAGIRGLWTRRTEDWAFLATQAAAEIRQIDKQIAAAEIREAIARKDLEIHDRQTLQAEVVETFMRGKYTNEELHSWRVSQLSSLFFQSYQMAYDLAQKAERAFRHELGVDEASFIEFGNWDNLRKGLLSGERLELQLRRLESAYLEENRREYELTNHVSLALLNPLALLRLKQEGRCEIELPEELFDLDYPGHYFRRIKSASISIPAVTGPYTSVSCTLRLLRSSIRQQSTLLNGQYVRVNNNDPRFSDSFGAIQSIAASSCQNDSGVFELNFRDERYLPFEGAGAISRWQLEMPNQFRQFDYDSISDVILHIKFTAREGGRALQDAVNQHLLAGINALVTGEDAPGLHQPISARHEFPTEFHRFLHPPAAATAHTLHLDLGKNRFPFVFRDRTIQLSTLHLFLKLERGFALDGGSLNFELQREGGSSFPATWRLSGSLAKGLAYANAFADQNQELGIWLLHINESDIASLPKQLRVDIETQGVLHTRLNPNAIDDILMICQYRVA